MEKTIEDRISILEDKILALPYFTDNQRAIFKAYKVYRRWYCPSNRIYLSRRFKDFLRAFESLSAPTADEILGQVEYEEMKKAYDDPENKRIFLNPDFIAWDEKESDWYVQHYRSLGVEIKI